MNSNVETQVKELIDYTESLVPGAVKVMAKDSGAKSSDLYRIPVEHIHVRVGYNPRLDTEHYREKLKELQASIMENGFYDSKPLAAIVVQEDGINKLYVEDGHRRFAAAVAAKAAGAPIDMLPVVVLPRGMSPEERLVHMYKSNNEGEKFTPLETAIVVQRLRGFGWDEKQVAAKLGITATYVRQLELLSSAPKAIREFVKSGELSATFAIEAMQEHGSAAEEVLTDAVDTAKKTGRKATKKTTTKKKMTKTEAEAKSQRLQKKHAIEAFTLLKAVFDKNGKHIDSEFHSQMDALFVQCGVI